MCSIMVLKVKSSLKVCVCINVAKCSRLLTKPYFSVFCLKIREEFQPGHFE